jgi:hypothetical protein
MKFGNMPHGLTDIEQIKFNSKSFESEICPKCKHEDKTFYNYFTDLPQYGWVRPVHPHVGRCLNRQCRHTYTPENYYADEYYLQLLSASLKGYEENYFFTFLNNHFGADIANRLVSMYRIGTSMQLKGATIFWPIDTAGKVRGGKIVLYSPTTGKRVKESSKHMHWVHESVLCPHIALRQCFFGEHLLNGNVKPVAIVESEESALIASIFMPHFVWLAVGSKYCLNPDQFKVLKGRTVIMWPKLGAYDLWNEKAQELSIITNVTVSDYLERIATDEERKAGLDIANYLLELDLKQYTPAEPVQATPHTHSDFGLPNAILSNQFIEDIKVL